MVLVIFAAPYSLNGVAEEMMISLNKDIALAFKETQFQIAIIIE